MNLKLAKLSISKNSSLKERFAIDAGGESLTGYRASAYVKYRFSDASPAIVLDAKVDVENRVVEVFAPANKVSSLRCGQHIYFVELIKGQTSLSASNYIDLNP